MFDMHVHTHANVDATHIFNTLCDQIMLPFSPHDTVGQATFDHFTGWYYVGYYGYVWSKAFSSDMYFSKFHQSHSMDPTVGQLFREQVLFPGGSVDEMSLIKSFLGRPPNPLAFLICISFKFF
ncbi:hypothetical protein HMI56_006991 [Coelomomyces lativittatus]|nr:hypothetical protein HMI56_006991 [Coelomomyces lativittatus]